MALPYVVTRWTLPTARPLALLDCVDDFVTETYMRWQVAPRQADLLADLAAELVEKVLTTADPYVTVTAQIEGRRATISAASAAVHEPPYTALLPQLDEPMDSTTGVVRLAGGLCAFAAVNLLPPPGAADRVPARREGR
ncbi:hypothetical protein [Streptomyces sp. NPDC046976]|uniref:hypothetical protein n=1 Tax=Streptomyces sp. NPDC046976 TaxID=3155258 RepID=UPI0033E5561E